MALECRVVEAPARAPKVFLSGAIDEHSTLDDVFAKVTKAVGGSLVMNLQGIIRINSLGIRGWIPLMSSLTKGRQVSVEALSYPLVLQANNVANLLAAAQIVSCMAPYFCSLCEANRMVLITADELRGGDGTVPAKACGDCGTPMEFDELDDYFSCLRRAA